MDTARSIPQISLAALLLCAWNANASPGTGSPQQIIAQARADLTPAGNAWAKAEADKIRSSQIEVSEVEKDAAGVTQGTVAGANPDELVLIALVDARPSQNEPPAPSATGRATLEQSIQNVIQTLTDTQRPAPRKQL